MKSCERSLFEAWLKTAGMRTTTDWLEGIAQHSKSFSSLASLNLMNCLIKSKFNTKTLGLDQHELAESFLTDEKRKEMLASVSGKLDWSVSHCVVDEKKESIFDESNEDDNKMEQLDYIEMEESDVVPEKIESVVLDSQSASGSLLTESELQTVRLRVSF
jgi:hypothetical protein